MKRDYKKLARNSFLITSIIFLFASCAKYNYYYASMEPIQNESSIKKYTHSCTYFIERYRTYNSDSVDFSIEFDKKKMEMNMGMDNNKPVYIDYAESRINVNNISHRIKPPEKIKNNNGTVFFSRPKSYYTIGSAYTIGSVLYNSKPYLDLYDQYDEKEYTNYTPNINEVNMIYTGDACGLDSSGYEKLRHSTILRKDFTEENTPLKINMEIVYYTDSLLQNPDTVRIDFYQSRLLKIKNIKYSKAREVIDYHWGEEFGAGIKGVTFYSKRKSGMAPLNWKEITYGLRWAVTIPVLPVIVIIDYTAFFIKGKEDGDVLIPIPLF